MPKPRARMLVSVCAAVACLLPAGAAVAQDQVPNDNSSVDQYSESLPSSEGGRAPSVGGRAPVGVPLSPRVSRALPGGERGRVLRRVATDTTLGAPARETKFKNRLAPATNRPAAVSAVTDGLFGSSAIWLILVLVLVSAAAAAGAFLRRRSI